MSVLQLVTDRDRRGAQVYAMDLHQGLQDLGLNVETVALAPGLHGDLLPIEALGPSRRSLRTLWALRNRARQSDIVIAHGSSTLFACAIGLAFARVPFVYRQISDPLFWAASATRRFRVASMIRRAAGIVALADSSRDVLMSHYRLARERITVIPNAVPAANFHVPSESARLAARERFHLRPDDRVVLYMGALAREKGVDLFIRCAAAIDGISALVVGDGPERKQLEQLASELGGSRIIFTGSIDDPTVAFFAADLIVLASTGGDSMPAVLIEAGLCGVPAVVSPVGAITDVVVHGETGIVVPIGDQRALDAAVRELVNDEDKRRSLGAAAHERCARRFTIDVTAPRWVDLLSWSV